MLIGCFDESGSTGEGGFVSIAGFVAPEERWAAFDAAWNTALAKHRVPYLHTTDLANFKRIYKGWTVDQQRALVADLMTVIWGKVDSRFSISACSFLILSPVELTSMQSGATIRSIDA